jgi:hypothetical protein
MSRAPVQTVNLLDKRKTCQITTKKKEKDLMINSWYLDETICYCKIYDMKWEIIKNNK